MPDDWTGDFLSALSAEIMCRLHPVHVLPAERDRPVPGRALLNHSRDRVISHEPESAST
jgi:hypothetical protein